MHHNVFEGPFHPVGGLVGLKNCHAVTRVVTASGNVARDNERERLKGTEEERVVLTEGVADHGSANASVQRERRIQESIRRER